MMSNIDTKALETLTKRSNWFLRMNVENDWSWVLLGDPPLEQAAIELAELKERFNNRGDRLLAMAEIINNLRNQEFDRQAAMDDKSNRSGWTCVVCDEFVPGNVTNHEHDSAKIIAELRTELEEKNYDIKILTNGHARLREEVERLEQYKELYLNMCALLSKDEK